MATYTQIQTRAQAMAMSQNAADAALFANEVYAEIVAMLDLNPQSVTKTLTAGTWQYDTTTDWALSTLTSIDYITYQAPGATNYDILEPTSAQEVIIRNRAVGTGYCRIYALRGTTKVLLSPIPMGSDVLNIYYQASPTALSAGTDTPTLIPSEWQYVVTWGTAARLAQEEGLDLAPALEQQYQGARENLQRWVEQRKTEVSERVGVGYPRSPRLRVRRDQDFSIGW